jgi:hypothetical protein
MKTFQILEKVKTMKIIFDPSWVDGCPGCPGPVFGDAIGDYMVAGLLRDIASNLQNKNIRDSLLNLSKLMVEKSSKGLLAGWKFGDDICPPWWPFPPKPWPRPDPWPWSKHGLFGDVDPDSSPAMPIPGIAEFSKGMGELMLAGALKHLASLTTDKGFSKEIFAQGQQIVKGISTDISNEYSNTVPMPRKKPEYRRNNQKE